MNWRLVSGLFGLILFSYGFIAAIFLNSIMWYYYFTIGGTLFLGYINHLVGNKTFFYKLENKRKILLKTYLSYIFAAIMLDIIGLYILKLWQYPYLGFGKTMFYSWILSYPFMFFATYELLNIIKKISGMFNVSIALTTFVAAFTNEIPNTFVWTWIYNIPYVRFAIFKINIVVIVGWIILVSIPVFIEKNLDSNSYKVLTRH